MTPIKTHLTESLIGKRAHFRCDCVMNIDVVGVVKGWSMYQNEILWDVLLDNGKLIKIGENHPNMNIEVL